MKFNEDCYKLEEKKYTKGLFDDSVDMTYVITMKTSTTLVTQGLTNGVRAFVTYAKSLKYCVHVLTFF